VRRDQKRDSRGRFIPGTAAKLARLHLIHRSWETLEPIVEKLAKSGLYIDRLEPERPFPDYGERRELPTGPGLHSALVTMEMHYRKPR
jgi:hypothetical protein